MDKQEAKEILENWLLSSKGSKERCGYIEGWFVEDDENAFLMAIEALQDDWVPVSERLPEDGYWLWSATSGEVKKDFYWNGHWEQAEELGYEVIAWRPLPAPYMDCGAKMEEGVVMLPNYVHLVYGEEVQGDDVIVFEEKEQEQEDE